MEKYNRYTYIGRARKENRLYYELQCECGKRVLKKDLEAVKKGRATQCNDCRLRATDFIKIGSTWGSWNVLEERNRTTWGERSYLCRCKCGKEKIVRKFDLYKGKSIQCHGCAISKRNITHNGSKSPTYQIWAGIKLRCKNPNNKSYKWYGGRGITYDARWEQYENFLADMGIRPDGLCIDRIDPDGDYSKENCRWVTPKENQENRRSSKKHFDKYAWVNLEKICSHCKATMKSNIQSI